MYFGCLIYIHGRPTYIQRSDGGMCSHQQPHYIGVGLGTYTHMHTQNGQPLIHKRRRRYMQIHTHNKELMNIHTGADIDTHLVLGE